MKKNIIIAITLALICIIVIIFTNTFQQENKVKNSNSIKNTFNLNEQGKIVDVQGEDAEKDPNYVIEIGNTKKIIDSKQWKFIDSSSEGIYSKNYSAYRKMSDEKFEQIVTVFLNKMADDRKSGEKITNSEYVEAFVLHPNSITVQIRVDKGDYWILSRQTFESKNNYPIQTNVSYSELLSNFEDMQNKIDTTRFMINTNF